ncbi:kumamolisin [Microlunatus flavus]|uniref:Kumamolisin n=1 Tax=Microlunatus flavus TaxID=1036181 RepID=A0A1H9NFI2_9ACTN|nr:kumamolisin [Microlunatus flavus]
MLPTGAEVGGSAGLPPALTVDVVLRSHDPAGMRDLARELGRPGSPSFRNFLTPAEVHARFGPLPEDVEAVSAWLRSERLTPGPPTGGGLVVSATGSPEQVARAFKTSFGTYRLADGRPVFANRSAPQVPAQLRSAIDGVVGLNNLVAPDHLNGRARSTAAPSPCSAAVKSAKKAKAYTYDKLAKAYGLDALLAAGHRGAGRTIGLFELDNWSTKDVATFQKCYGTHAKVEQVEVGAGAPDENVGEATLDIETAIALAPEADVLVYNTQYSDLDSYPAAAVDEYARIVDDNRADVLSISYGACESWVEETDPSFITTENVLFQEAALQGISVLASSGDEGSEGCHRLRDGDKSLSVEDPASQPYVTGVGGTTLSKVKGPKEKVWNGRRSGSTGGGVSELWPMPVWQSGRGVIGKDSSGAPCGSAGYCRQVPDVAASADPNHGYGIYVDGRWEGFGGTSAATPLWAALVADVLSSVDDPTARLGFLNPVLYSAAATSKKAPFHDVRSGNNDWTRSHHKSYSARKGYDMATGLGTPNAGRLLKALAPLTEGIRFTDANGTGAPPSSLGSFSLHPYPDDSCEPGTSPTSVEGPRTITLSSALDCYQVGPDWATWSHGYDGVVYVVRDNPGAFSTVTLQLPAGTKAFYFYAEPDEFETFNLMATESSGASSGPLQVYGDSGAQFYGFYAQGSSSISSITVSCDTDFALGEFGTN